MREPRVDVFVSYSMDETGKRLLDDIRPHLPDNVKLFVADERPTPGQPVTAKIRSNIRKCEVFLALLTDSASKSQWVNQEIGIARELDKWIIPVKVKGVIVTGFLTGIEWIEVDPDNPEKSSKALSLTFNELISRKREFLQRQEMLEDMEMHARQERQKWGAIALGALALIGAVILAFLFLGKKK